MMRTLAWCGTISEMSSGPRPASAMARSADSTTTRTARRKTSLPSMNSVPPCSHLRRCRSEPSEFMFQLMRLPGPSTGSTTTAPAPSPTMMAILRSSMSVMRERVSEPMSRTGPEPMEMRPAAVTRP